MRNTSMPNFRLPGEAWYHVFVKASYRMRILPKSSFLTRSTSQEFRCFDSSNGSRQRWAVRVSTNGSRRDCWAAMRHGGTSLSRWMTELLVAPSTDSRIGPTTTPQHIRPTTCFRTGEEPEKQSSARPGGRKRDLRDQASSLIGTWCSHWDGLPTARPGQLDGVEAVGVHERSLRQMCAFVRRLLPRVSLTTSGRLPRTRSAERDERLACGNVPRGNLEAARV